MNSVDLKDYFGNLDIYLFDQILKGRISREMSILDAGCGSGRNLIFFLRNGFEVYGVDQSQMAIRNLRGTAQELAPHIPEKNFQKESIESLTLENHTFDVIICNAVLHFANDQTHFDRMLYSMWRILKPDGMFFSRLASSIGIEDRVHLINGRNYHLPDGSDRFLVDEAMLLDYTEKLNAELLDPIKTVNVQNQRCMTTWVLRKS